MLVYIDESGHPRPKDSSTRPVILAVCIKESDTGRLNRALFSLRRNHLSGVTLGKADAESKAVVFLNRGSILGHNAKREYVESLFEFLRDFEMTVFGITMHRPERQPYEGVETLPTQYRWLLERIERFMEHDHPKHWALPVFDTRDPGQNRILSESFTAFMATSPEGRAMQHIVPSALFVDSALTPGIQIADWFAYVIRLNEEHELYRQHALKDPYLSAIKRYVSIVKTKTQDHAKEDGFIHYGLATMDASKFDYEPPAPRRDTTTEDAAGREAGTENS